MIRLVGFIGLISLIVVSIFLSTNKKAIDKKLVVVGLGLQILLGLLILGIPVLGIEGPLRLFFDLANTAIIELLNFSSDGAKFLFGSLAEGKKHGFIFAIQIFSTIIFISSLMAVLYYWGIMQKIVGLIAKGMQKLMGTSGAESLSMAANIFVGQTEAPLLVKPYVERMTKSELAAVMIGGMATVAGAVFAAFVGLLQDVIPNIAGHLLTASVMSAPAALVVAKIMVPEEETPETLGTLPDAKLEEKDANVIEAAARGASEGLKLALNVGAMVLAFVALIATLDGLLKLVGHWVYFYEWGHSFVPDLLLQGNKQPELSMSLIFGWLFAPFAFLMGIPWSEAAIAGTLLGQKVVINEFIAYLSLSQLGADLSERTMIILSYALCGFANFSSIAIQIGGIGSIAPSRRGDLAQMGFKAVIGGSIAAFMTATIAGLLI